MKKGFTLIETMLYVVLLAMFISLVGAIFVWVVNANLTTRAVRDLESEGLRALQIMVNSIRNGYAINFPAVGISSPTLTILKSSDPSDITRFSLVNNQILISENGGVSIAITSTAVSVQTLNFTNVSRPGTAGAVTMSFKITNKKHEKNFYVSASLRRK